MLEKLQDKGMHLLAAIDEVTANRQIRLFASIYQIMICRGFPISLIMTGLPRNISELQNDKVLTFLLRSARIDLPMLNDVNVQYSYKETFEKGLFRNAYAQIYEESSRMDREFLKAAAAIL